MPVTRKQKRTGAKKRWSGEVTRDSNALDLEPRVFTISNARRIALSLKRFADKSRRRKGTPYQSAVSMLNFYIRLGPVMRFAKAATLKLAVCKCAQFSCIADLEYF